MKLHEKWKSSDKKNCFQGCPLFTRVEVLKASMQRKETLQLIFKNEKI